MSRAWKQERNQYRNIMEYNYHRGDYLRWHQVHEQIGKITGIDTFRNIIELTDKDGICLANIEDFEPIPIEPDVLEAFGFKKDIALNDIEFWHILLGEVDIAVIPSSKGWWVRISGKNYASVQVCNIHDIQHAMRVAGITKELEYKEK